MQWKYYTFYGDWVLLFQVEVFQFSKFHEDVSKLDKSNLREAWTWHAFASLFLLRVIEQTIYKFSKRNRKIWKSIKFEKGLLEQFPHISTTYFAVLFLSENFKKENGNFRKYHACFFLLPLVSRFISL